KSLRVTQDGSASPKMPPWGRAIAASASERAKPECSSRWMPGGLTRFLRGPPVGLGTGTARRSDYVPPRPGERVRNGDGAVVGPATVTSLRVGPVAGRGGS